MDLNRTCASWAAALASLFCLTALAEAEVTEEVRAVFERNIEGLGGRALIETVDSLRLSGSMSIAAMRMTATMEMVVAHPDKLYVKQDLPGMGEVVQVIDGDTGWAQDPMQGFRKMGKEEVAALRSQYDGVRDALEYESRFSSAEALPEVSIDGVALTPLRLVSAASGETETRYFSKETGRLERMEALADMGAMGRLNVSVSLSDYRELAFGIFYPHRTVVATAAMTIEIVAEEAEVNGAVDAALFLPPQG